MTACVSEVVLHPIAKGHVLDGQHWAPLHYQRLLGSRWRVVAMREENRGAALFGFLLWFESLRQDPPGTLPDDDRELAMLAGFGMDVAGWMAVRDFALYGWRPCHVCDAGGDVLPGMRLSHEFVTQVAVEASRRKAGASVRREAGLRAVRKSRIRGKLRAMMPGGREAPDAAVEWIADWLSEGDLNATEANIKIGWDRFTGREGGSVKSL